jgi:hypothetical protein
MSVVINTQVAGGGGGGGGEVETIVAGSGITVDATDPANPIISASGGGTLDPVTLGAGPTSITHDDHSNRAVYSEQALTTSVVFAVAATSGAEDGDLVTILNLGAGPMVASGANVRLAPGNRAYAKENERLVFEYFADDDIYYGGCPDVNKSGSSLSWAITPIAGSTTISATGCGQPVALDTSTVTSVAVAATSAFTHHQRVSWVSAAAANRTAGATLTTPVLWPTAAIPFGWQTRAIFGAHDAVALTGCQMLCGLVGTSIAAGAEPSAKTNIFAVAKDSGETNLSIYYNNAAGSATPIALGASFPGDSNAADLYDVILAAWSDGTAVHAYYQVTNMISKVTAFGTVTGAELPVDGTGPMLYNLMRGTEANVTAATVVCGGYYGGFWS